MRSRLFEAIRALGRSSQDRSASLVAPSFQDLSSLASTGVDRRQFLRYLSAMPLAASVDVEKLLWMPGEKTIFIPKHRGLTVSQIVETEWTVYMRNIYSLLERDDLFYRKLGRVDNIGD